MLSNVAGGFEGSGGIGAAVRGAAAGRPGKLWARRGSQKSAYIQARQFQNLRSADQVSFLALVFA